MHSSKAFSLVELSIVLVILGLLTGGILAGQSLIRASELRALSSELQRFQAATHTFRDKYFMIPGDFRDATRFWGRQANVASCTTNSGAAVGTPGACDGDGDGSVGTPGITAAAYTEPYQFWYHLALAGLIEGSYTGMAGTHGYDATPGSNIPASRIAQGGWLAWSKGVAATGGSIYVLDYGNAFNFGKRSSASVFTRQSSLLRPEEMWNLDTKLDDGRPAYGNIIAYSWGNVVGDNDCTINAADENDLNSDYSLANTALVCGFWARNAF
jgi:prepilin-type N-terminal cleavage/methylation domain-containing protein